MEDTNNAGNCSVTAMTLLYVTLLATIWLHYDPAIMEGLFQDSHWWNYSWHSHHSTTFTSIFVSLFTHSDGEHLLGNMFLLWTAGRRVFMNHRRTNQAAWTSPWAFVWIYIGSELLSVGGCRLLSYWLDQAWKRKLVQGRSGWWKCVPISWRDTWSTLFNASQVVPLRVWQFAPMIGASAAVFGIVGAHVYTSICSKRHPSSMDAMEKLFWLTCISMELVGTPFTLDQVSLLFEDNIDHASHLCGFVGGFSLAFLWEHWHRKPDKAINQAIGTSL